MDFSKWSDRPWKRILWIAALAALAYLPRALQLTYYRDDWYYAYDAMVGPAGVFRYMFAEDRPLRGPFFEMYHLLFGIAPTPYHLAMLFWRFAGGAAVVWLLHLLWPRRGSAGLVAGALFALYPGFTWWVQGIEYQPMVASAALTVVSLCLTVLALRIESLWARLVCIGGAILTGWLYLGLVEYAAGMELLRLGLVYLAIDDPKLRTFKARAQAALPKWLPYLIIPAGFLVWRFLFFSSARKATDLGAQLAGFFADPVSTGLHWLMNLLLSFINVALAAWIQPLLDSFFSLRLRDQVMALGFALVAAVLIWMLLRRVETSAARKRTPSDENWTTHAIWLGVAGILLGILPVVAANRQITLPSFSHYALPASLGLAFLTVGLVSLLSRPSAQIGIFTFLISLSVLTLHGLGADALREEQTIASFWHQMAWRAASIQRGATLLAYYPGVDYGTDSDVVWGPADFIYYPEAQQQLPIVAPIAALTADRNAINDVLAGRDLQASTYRTHTMNIDYANVLVAVQSTADACVRVLDPRWPTYAAADEASLRPLAASAHVDSIVGSSAAAVPPPWLFGAEPDHGWCYYFEKASAASQQGDWLQVAAIQAQIGSLGLQPNDQIEWMPFLQAQAYLGDLKAVRDIGSRINTEKLYKRQACQILNAMQEHGYPLPGEAQAYVNALFCGAQ